MKRLQIYLEPSADDALATEAARDGTSKAAIIRRLIDEHIGTDRKPDPIDALVGAFTYSTENIDEVVYGESIDHVGNHR